MTIRDFVTAIGFSTPDDWFLDDGLHGGGALRRIDSEFRHWRLGQGRLCCPITALGQEATPVSYPRDAKRLGLSARDMETIATTSDNMVNHPAFDPTLRLALLKATVLRDKPANEEQAAA